MTGCFTVSGMPPTEDNELRATKALVQMWRLPAEGEPIEARPGMLVQRTGKPFHVLHAHYVPHSTPLKLQDSPRRGAVFYTDTDSFEERTIPARYFTTAYFTVLAQHVPTADELQRVFEKARNEIPDRPIVWPDIEAEMAYFGINPPDEIKRYWLTRLNDREVDLKKLIKYLSRLVNVFADPASDRRESLAELKAMDIDQLRSVLRANPHDGWRRQLVYIGLVFENRDQFLVGDVLAALNGLTKYRP